MKTKLLRLLLALITLFPLAALADNQPFIRAYPAGTALPGSGPGNPTPAPGSQTHAVTDQFGNQLMIGSSSVPLQPDIVTSTTMDMTSATGSAVATCDGRATAAFQFTRTTETGSIEFDYTTDDLLWIKITELFYKSNSGFPAEINQSASTGVETAALSNNKIFLFDCAGKKKVRAFVNVVGLGAALPVVIRTSAFPSGLIQNIRPGTTASALGKSEDAVHNSQDVGVAAWGVINTNGGTTFAANGDYAPIALDTAGRPIVDVNYSNQTSAGNGLLKREDDAAGSSDAGPEVFGVREDALTANTNLSGDLTPFKTDSSGRIIQTDAPVGEQWNSCSAAVINTTSTSIKASVASNRLYTKWLTCRNNTAVPSGFLIQDGSGGTTLATGGVGAVGAAFATTFPTPIRSTSATGLFVIMDVTATSTICCAGGFISTQ